MVNHPNRRRILPTEDGYERSRHDLIEERVREELARDMEKTVANYEAQIDGLTKAIDYHAIEIGGLAVTRRAMIEELERMRG